MNITNKFVCLVVSVIISMPSALGGKWGGVVTFQKNAWNALKSANDPQYGPETAKAGKLKGTLVDNHSIPLLCVPPTRLSGPCSRVLYTLLNKKGDLY